MSLDKEIPEYWDYSIVKDYCKVNQINRNPEKEFPDKEFDYVTVSCVDGEAGKIEQTQKEIGKDAPSRAKREIHEGDVIVSTTRPYLRAFAIVPEELDGAICSTAFAVLTPGEDVLTKFLWYAVRFEDFVNQLKKKQRGASYPAVGIKDVKNSKIPVPPLEEQKIIVEELNEIFDSIEEIQDAQEQAEEIRDILLESAINHTYGSLDGEEKDLDKVVKILMGSSPPGESYNEDGEGKPFIQGANKFGDKYPTEGKFTTEPERLCQKDDVLITIRAGVGDLNIADKEYCIGRGIAGLRPQEISRDYLYFYLKGMNNYWDEVSSGSTYQSITKKNLKNAPITIVSKEKQKEVVRYLRQIEQNVANLTRKFEQSKEITEDLPNSVLAKAFKSDLVDFNSKSDVSLSNNTDGIESEAETEGQKELGEFD
jgi:type I restriction enzyme S subunit